MIATKGSNTARLNWEVQKAKLRVCFPELTDADLNFDETKKNETLNKIQVKLGKTINEIKSIIDTL